MKKTYSLTREVALTLLPAALLLASTLGSALHAGVIPGVTVSSASSKWYSVTTSNPDYRDQTNLVNGTGLRGDVLTTIPGGSMWLATNAVYPPLTSTNQLVGSAFVTFDLGSVTEVDTMKVWNYNETANRQRGVKVADISYSTDGTTFTTNLPAYTFNVAPGTYSAFPQLIPMGGVQARYVQINVNTNYGLTGSFAKDLQVGLGKVRFINTNLAPAIAAATRNYGNSQVTVQFGEAMDLTSATNLANYSITGGSPSPTILSATMNLYSNAVVLQTTPLSSSQSYTLVVSGVYDEALVSSIPANTQAPIQSEVVLWLKSDQGVVADSSGNISQWSDQSGYGNNALQATTGIQPQFLGTPSGMQAVHFDGISQYLQVPNSSSLTLDGDVTVYAVFSADGLTQAQDLISKTGGAANAYSNNMPAPFDLQIPTTGKPSFVWGNQGVGGSYVAVGSIASVVTANQFYIITCVVRGTNITTYVNEMITANSAPYLGGPADAGNPMRLGIRADAQAGAPKLMGYMAEAMIISGTLTDSDRLAIDSYLGSKYGIAVNPITFTEPPLSLTRTQGQTATFWVNAVAAFPTAISYQWQKNGTNISGATTAIYTTPSVTMADNGASYSALLSVAGFTNSRAATLTVVQAPPTILSASRSSSNSTDIVVVYSWAVNPLTATVASNYSLNNGVTVSSVAPGSAANQVIVTTSGLNTNSTYWLGVANVNDLYGTPLSPKPGLVLPANLSLWLRPDAGVLTDASGLVSEWDDQGPNANSAKQYTEPQIALVAGQSYSGAVYRPALNPSPRVYMNGLPVLTFNGSSSYLNAASTPSLALTSNMSIYVVANAYDLAATREFVGKTKVNLPGPYDYYAGSAYNTLYRGNGTNSYNYVRSVSAASAGVPHVFNVVMSGLTVSHFLDGAAIGVGNMAATTIADPGSALGIGSRNDLAVWMKGEIAEILIFGAAISTLDRTNIDNYLAQKYYPFSITQQPVDASAAAGTTATFSVGATEGSAHFSYQWLSNSVSIPNATNASYTTPALALTDNGETYGVAVMVPGWSTNYSSSAVLAVQANNQPPIVYSATKQTGNSTTIVLVYSWIMGPASATNVSNYTLNNGVTITKAAMGSAANQVILTTSGLTAGATYFLSVQNVQDAFGNTIAPITVQVLPSNLVMSLRADAGVVADASGLVSKWSDVTANGNNAIQANGPVYMPTLTAGAMNGMPALTFDGIGSYLQAAPAPSLVLTGDLSFYVVVNLTDLGTVTPNVARELLSKTLGNKPAPFDYYVGGSLLDATLYRGDGNNNGHVVSVAPPTTGVPHVLSVGMQGTNVSHFLDGTANGSGTISTSIADAGTPLGIGARNDLAQFMYGGMSEVLIFNAALSPADRIAVDNYLGLKYFPFSIVTQPANVTTLEGLTATFAVAATQGSTHFSYQWLSNSVSIPNATNASYTTPVLTLADNGSTYQVVIFVPQATQPTLIPYYSDPATLTVQVDTVPPTVLAAAVPVWTRSQIRVLYSKAVSLATATNASNYALDNSASITAVALGETPNEFILSTSPLTNGITYSLTVQNVQDLFNNTIVPTPVPVTGVYPFSTVLWLKADTGVLFDPSGYVDEWDDQSGNYNEATQYAGETFMPTVTTNAFNGNPAIHFNGTSNYLVVASSPSLAITGDLSLYVVARFVDYNAQRELLGKTVTNQPASYDYYVSTNANFFTFYRGNGVSGGAASVKAAALPSTGVPHVLSVVMGGTNVTHFLDGLTNGSGTLHTTMADGGTPLDIGTRGDFVGFMEGDIAEIFIFSAALSTADRLAIDNYLGAKYGILVVAPPMLSVAQAGSSVVLSWPTPSMNFVLESALALPASSWAAVTNSVVTANGVNSVTVNPTATQQFFRLQKQ